MLKKCAYCHRYKEETEFLKWQNRLHSYCKPCKRTIDREYIRAKREIAKSDKGETNG